MPANKSNVSTPRKEKSGDKLYTLTTSAAAAASRKKKRSLPFVKHKHYAQYLVSVSDELKRKTKRKKKEKERKMHCDTNRAAMYEKGRASRPFVRRRRSMELRSIVPRIIAARSTLLEYVVFRVVTSPPLPPPLQDMGVQTLTL